MSVVACLVVGTMFLGVSLVDHTDDGCPIEIHCTVCLTHLAGLATQTSVPSLAPLPSLDIAQPDLAPSVGDSGTPSTLDIRGPPAA